MAITHIQYNGNTSMAGKLLNMLANLEAGKEGLADIVTTMGLMLDGDGTSEAHFTSYVQGAFGFPDAATAKAGWDELNAAHAKISATGSVSNVHGALEQLFNKFR